MAVSPPWSDSAPVEPSAVRRLIRYRWLVVAVLGLDGALLSFHYVAGATLSGHHAVTWRLDAAQLGVLAALGFLPYALMQVPGGYATDRFGGRHMLTAALVVTAAGTALFAMAPAYEVAATGRVVLGVGSAVILLPSLAVLARWFRTREYATMQGGYLLLAALGSLAATVPLALAADRWGWRAPMLAVALITVLGAGLSWLFVRNDPSDLGLPAIRLIDPDAEASNPAAGRLSLREGLEMWRGVPTLWISSLLLFASWGALQAFQGLWAGPILRHVRGFTATEVGQSLLMFTLGVGLGPVLFGWLSDRVVGARRPVVVAAVLGQAVLWLAVIVGIDRLPTALLNAAFLGIAGLSGGVLVAQVMVKELSPPGGFGTIFGIVNGSGFYGTAVIQVVTGAILTGIGPDVAGEEPVYGARAYTLALLPIVGQLAVAAVMAFRLAETLPAGREQWPPRTS